ncbi:MAG TPA: hypothetical protein VGQ37_27070 [Vicinamibacterales bacterium]|jgi:hypothetical protein|nr:hypothetical protein [Vicinamibacterales bacterium]
MRLRSSALLAAALVTLGAATIASQGTGRWNPPRTSDGRPDLQGYWTNDSYVPLERPDEARGKDYYTAEEAQLFLKSRIDRLNGQSQTDIHYDDALWQAESYAKQAHMRTSIIYDPPDGKLPPLTAAARQREAARVQARKGVGPADNAQVRTLAERCIAWGNVGPPMLPPVYNANFQILQSPDLVVLRHEMMHDVRLIPLDGPRVPSLAVQQLAGIARGRWEGDTLVVETTNFTGKTNFRGSPQSTRQDIFASETMRVVERFRMSGPDTIDYRFTVEDPSVWERSWSGEAPLRRFQGPIYEYACHEGNYGLPNILRAARVQEAAGQVVDAPVPFNRFAPK